MIRKAVIPVAGLGTRLLSATKEQPKEMLPVFTKDNNKTLCLKPLVQLIFEQLHSFGVRDFCFIVGRGKRAIEDHFTSDYYFIKSLINKGRTSQASQLRAFYRMVETSTIVWVNQPEPRGFGDAVLQAKSFIGNEPFIVAAGDTYIISKNFIERMTEKFFARDPLAVLLLQKVSNPRDYGVAVTDKEKVLHVVEKPEKPLSDLAIMPFYIFKPIIFQKLSDVKPGVGNEIQLTDAIQRLIDVGHVEAELLRDDEVKLDIGTPESYWLALKESYEHSKV
ncbi:MAG: sugar phosphate nucleotidyltransferase [Candidatus Bathyarchaeia archaeon]